MRIRDIIACIEEMAPLSGAADWDRSGLQVYSPRTEASRVCVALDPTPETVKKALGEGADFIFTHHPLALKPGLPNRPGNYYETLSLLIKADVPLYAAHTTLDVQPDGPAGWLPVSSSSCTRPSSMPQALTRASASRAICPEP